MFLCRVEASERRNVGRKIEQYALKAPWERKGCISFQNSLMFRSDGAFSKILIFSTAAADRQHITPQGFCKK
jgi:hypothetical protein